MFRLRTKTRISPLNDIRSKIPQKSFGFCSSRSLKTEKFENAVVIHFAIVVPTARQNFEGGNIIEICGKTRCETFPASPKPRMRGEQISTELVAALVNNFARTIHRIDVHVRQ